MPSVGSGSRVPPGGTSGSFLQKKSAVDYDYQWVISPTGPKGDQGDVGPQGDPGAKGDPGADGVTPTFTVNVTTLAAGANATASVTGNAANPVLNLGIPQGPTGSSASVSYVSSNKWGTD